MKRPQFIILLFAGLNLLANQGWARPVDLSAPKGGLGAAGLYGDLELWQEVDGIGLQLGQGSYLPMRYKFTSDSSVRGILGPGFYVPMFEAKNVLIREQMMRAFLPCGKGLYLRRDTTDPTKFQTLDGEWTGLLKDDDFTIWRDDGWKLLYHKGRLTSLITDDNHTFMWNYDRGGMPTEISKDGQSIITVEPNAAGQVAAFIFNGKRYEMGYADRPLTQILLGQVVIKELDQALSSFKYPDGQMEIFKFSLTPGRSPTLTFINKKNQQTLYSWDPTTQHLLTEKGPQSDWTYKVGAITQTSGVPPISRTSPDNKVETMDIDAKEGIYAKQLSNGTKTIYHIFETPGPLYNKVRKIEKSQEVDGKEVMTTIYQASYDETGRLIRKVDGKGFTVDYAYDENGKFLKLMVNRPTDPAILAALKQKEENLLKLLSTISDPVKRGDALEELAFFYIHDCGFPEKALALLPQMTNRLQIFNVKFHAIDGDINLTGVQKAEKFKALEQQYPEEKHLLDILIVARPKDDQMTAKMMSKNN